MSLSVSHVGNDWVVGFPSSQPPSLGSIASDAGSSTGASPDRAKQCCLDCVVDVFFEFCLGNARRLEIQLIEPLLFGPRHDGAWSVGTTHLKRHAQANDGPKSIRSKQSAAPSDRRSPIMSDNDCLIRADRVEQSDHVSGQMQ